MIGVVKLGLNYTDRGDVYTKINLNFPVLGNLFYFTD